MVSVGQNHLGLGFPQLGRGDPLDCAQGANGHEAGGFDGAVGSGKVTRPSPGLAAASLAGERKSQSVGEKESENDVPQDTCDVWTLP